VRFAARILYFFSMFGTLAFTSLTSAAGKYFWDGVGASVSSRAMSGAGLTNPLIETQVPWASTKLADESWVVENSTLSSKVEEKNARFDVIGIKMESSGAFGPMEAASPEFENLDLLRSEITTHPRVPSISRVEYSARYFERGLAVGFSYAKRRMAQADVNGNIDFRFHRDLAGVLGVSGPLFDKGFAGRLEFGTTIKLINRKGDEVNFASTDSSVSLNADAFTKSAYAGGLDYSMLYTLPKNWTGDYALQLALNWKDIGETQFYLGSQTSKDARFEAFPNQQSIGAGLASPNIWRGTRAVLRLEYKQWFRDVSFWRKTVAAIELRAPKVLTLYAGTRGTVWSAGAAFRFPNIELGVASAGSDFGEGVSLVTARSLLVELKGVF
jgi:hypothetical protein